MRDLETNEPYTLSTDSNNQVKKVSPESLGWHKKIERWVMIIGKKPIYTPIAGRVTSFEVTEAIILRVYEVDAGICGHCERLGLEFDRIKNMSLKTGLYRKCFLGIYGTFGNSDFTTQHMDYSGEYSRKPLFTLIEERIVDFAEILQMVKKGEIQYIADSGIISQLEKHFGVQY